MAPVTGIACSHAVSLRLGSSAAASSSSSFCTGEPRQTARIASRRNRGNGAARKGRLVAMAGRQDDSGSNKDVAGAGMTWVSPDWLTSLFEKLRGPDDSGIPVADAKLDDVKDLLGGALFLPLFKWMLESGPVYRDMPRVRPRLPVSHMLESGPVYRLAAGPRNFVIIGEPEAAKHVLRGYGSIYAKGLVAEVAEFLFGSGFAIAEGDLWTARRRAVGPSLHRRYLETMVATVFASSTQHLVDKLRGSAARGEEVNMEAMFSQLTLDVIGLAVFNFQFDSLSTDSPLIQAVYTALKETESRSTDILPYWQVRARIAVQTGEAVGGWCCEPEVPLLCAIVPRQRKAAEAVRVIRETVEELVAQCKRMVEAENERRGDDEEYVNESDPSILRFLLASREEVSSVQLRDDLLSMLVAGHETTGSVLTWTNIPHFHTHPFHAIYLSASPRGHPSSPRLPFPFHPLSLPPLSPLPIRCPPPRHFSWQHPEKMAKAQEEAERVLAGKSHPSLADTRELKYLTRCINESMRLYPHPPVSAIYVIGASRSVHCEEAQRKHLYAALHHPTAPCTTLHSFTPALLVTAYNILIRRAVVADVLPGGYKVQPGQDMMISVYNIHHSPQVPTCTHASLSLPLHPTPFISAPWPHSLHLQSHSLIPFEVWERADEFMPERFDLDAPVPNEVNTDYRYIPFSGGPRKCIGDQFAMLEAICALSVLVREFDFALVPNQDISMTTGATIHTKNNLFVTRAPLVMAGEREGVPSDLEQRLQRAWMHVQLKTCRIVQDHPCGGHQGAHTHSHGGNTRGGGQQQPSLPPPQRTARDLTATLQQLWGNTQEPLVPPSDPRQPAPQPRPPPQPISYPCSLPPATSGASSQGNRTTSPGPSASSSSSHSNGLTPLQQPQAAAVPLNSAGQPCQQLSPSPSTSGGQPSPGGSPAPCPFVPGQAGGGGVWPRHGPNSVAEQLRELSAAEWMARVQQVEPVALGAEYMEADFFRGLDELTFAFDEMESLLPHDLNPAFLSAPPGAFHGASGDAGMGMGAGMGEEELLGMAVDRMVPAPQGMAPAHPPTSCARDGWQCAGQQGGGVEGTGSARSGESQGRADSQGRAEELMAQMQRAALNSPGGSQEGRTVEGEKGGAGEGEGGEGTGAVHVLVERLTAVASVYGDATQRVSAYFLEGLLARASGTAPTGAGCPGSDGAGAAGSLGIYRSIDCDAPLLRAFEVLVSASPYLTFGHVACNSAILEAIQGARKVHIVDFGLGHAVQWPPLIQALAVLPGGPPHLRITGIDRPFVAGIHKGYCLRQAGQRLRKVAQSWGVPFTFNFIPINLPDLQPSMVRCEADEVLVVNCALRLHNLMDESVTPSNPRAAVLRTMRALAPAVTTLVEQNTNHNSPFFLSRFLEALHYYASIFDALDASVPADSTERRLFEQRVLGRAIVNVVACEGQDRTERQEPLGQWERRVHRAGFVGYPLSREVVATATALLSTCVCWAWLIHACPLVMPLFCPVVLSLLPLLSCCLPLPHGRYKGPYSLSSEQPNSLTLNWKDQPLLAMSAWRPNS
ncbi:unnamed protein product [Closterium sp. NIES-65]|nr:unnamed protein product [Closterium sp. NIES-65]